MKPITIICANISLVILFGLILSASSYAAIDPETAVAVWLFNEGEGNEVKDETDNPANLTGVLQGRKITWIEGVYGNAIELGVDGDVVAVPAAFGDEAAPTAEITIVAWIRWTPKNQTDLFFFVPPAPWDNRIAVHFPWGADGIAWQFGRPMANLNAPMPKNFEDDWHHVAFTGSGKSMAIWIDGKIVADRGGVTPFVRGNNRAWHIGGRAGTTFEGWVDEVAVFNVVLTQADINAIKDKGLSHAVGLAVDPSGKLTTAWGNIKTRD